MENNESNLKFTEAENKIRKKWLFLSTILPAAVFACLGIISVIFSFMSSDFMAILAILVVAFISVGGGYINYHCAYKNPGTILLLLMMIGILLNLLMTFLSPSNLALMKASLLFSLVMLVTFIFGIVVFYYSYKLRKINKKMKERKLTASPVYINALSVFSTATNVEELNEQFKRLRTDDSKSTVEALGLAYDQQKKRLS